MERYVVKGQQRLRYGYTTGSCAAAAAKAAAYILLSGKMLTEVQIDTPKGWRLDLPVEDISRSAGGVSCAVKKDGGDDPDITNGILIYARVEHTADQEIVIEGGRGVGRVTQKGLSLAVGQAAINPVPRAMIYHEVDQIRTDLGVCGGLRIEISVPAGEEIARKTFNPRLGIVGGISIIGTSGIVEPMSEQALIETIRLEMRMLREKGVDHLLAVPGNYGETFAREQLGLDPSRGVKTSNFVGEVLDFAGQMGFSSLLLVGHVGKTVKLAAGIMNLHSRNADGRMEVLAAYAAAHGAGKELVRAILACSLTDQAVAMIAAAGLSGPVFADIAGKAEFHMAVRAGQGLKTGIILFSQQYGQLGVSPQGAELLSLLRRDGG